MVWVMVVIIACKHTLSRDRTFAPVPDISIWKNHLSRGHLLPSYGQD